jgi:acyl-CoA reductase-like NAD-dependent aldehyde dehydrogenase
MGTHAGVRSIPRWNFGLAIPADWRLAALAAGGGVALEPAPETVATAWRGPSCAVVVRGAAVRAMTPTTTPTPDW